MNNEFSVRLQKIQSALDNALRYDFSAQWQEGAFGTLPAAVTHDYIKKLIEPNKNLIDCGGKRWRPLLLVLCWELALSDLKSTKSAKNALSEEAAYSLTPLVEFVHTASLIHDDIEDSADLRRGKPSAHITYGLDTALNAASWLYFLSPLCLDSPLIPKDLSLSLYSLYTTELRRLHLGQAMDIYWHRNPDIFPSKEEYLAMVKCKTGTLSSLAAQTGFLAGGESPSVAKKYGEAAANIGIAFQIIDDVINLTRGNPGKKRGDDIVEGKKSLPVILHIQQFPQDKELLSSLFVKASKEGIESDAVESAVEMLLPQTEIAASYAKDLLLQNTKAFSQSSQITALFDSLISSL